MALQNEFGIATYVGNFNRIITACTKFGAAYAPTIENLTLDLLKKQHYAIQTAVDTADSIHYLLKARESDRQLAFAPLPALVVRVLGEAEAQTLPPKTINDIKELVRKIQGRRAKTIDPNETPDEHTHISVSQRSFDEQIRHLTELISLLSTQPTYNPVDITLGITQLTTLLGQLRSTNDATTNAEFDLITARQKRDLLLYQPITGMMDTGLRIKQQVKAIFGAASLQYKEVRHISFRNKAI